MWNPSNPRLAAAALASTLLLAACTGGASPSASAGSSGPPPTPAGSPSGSPGGVGGQIDHLTGATDLLLRFEEGGGFVAPTFAMISVPYFSLFGDGTVLYRPVSAPFPEQKPGEPLRFPPLRIARLTEAQVQRLLTDALGPAGLAVARARYDNMQVADAPTAVFTVNAGGLQRQVSIYALGIAIDDPANPNPDGPILAAMASFAERLRDFDREIAKGAGTDAGLYSPDRFRASLLEGAQGNAAVRPWPWPTFGPDAFTSIPGGPGPGFPSKVLSGLEVSLLGVERPEGGLSGITLAGPDGKTYGLGLRPLLPDEAR